jgi:hypothetical protein
MNSILHPSVLLIEMKPMPHEIKEFRNTAHSTIIILTDLSSIRIDSTLV